MDNGCCINIGRKYKDVFNIKMIEYNKKVSMDIKYTVGMIHISMSNLYDGSINKIDGHIISKKDDKDNHGYGLDSIKRIVDKYDGSMIKSYKNGKFEVDIIIYLE